MTKQVENIPFLVLRLTCFSLDTQQTFLNDTKKLTLFFLGAAFSTVKWTSAETMGHCSRSWYSYLSWLYAWLVSLSLYPYCVNFIVVKRRESLTVTDTKPHWVAPSLQKTANTHERLVEIDFTSSAAKRSILNQSLSDSQANILSASSVPKIDVKLLPLCQLIYPNYVQI